MLAILAGAIVWWICAVLPEFATALIMVALFALIGQIPATSGFSFFSNPIWWLLVGAFSIGLGMKETGLLERMALAIVSRFPSSFTAQVIGFFACGTILGPLIPSMAAKASLLAPLAMEVGDLRGYRRQGRQATGLFLAMFTGVQTAAPAFISSSIVGYTLLAIYPGSGPGAVRFRPLVRERASLVRPHGRAQPRGPGPDLLSGDAKTQPPIPSLPPKSQPSRAKTSSWPSVANWAA